MPSRKHRWEEEHYRFEAIFASSVDAILAVDPMRHVVLASPSVSRIFGYDPDELVGRSISILYARTEDFIEQGRLRYSQEAEDSLSAYEVEYRRKDGSTFPGEASGRRILSSKGSGAIAGYMVTIRDISRRRQLMNALAREKEQWFVTLKSLGEGVIVTDASGLVTFMNPAAELLTGWSFLEASGQPVSAVYVAVSEETQERQMDPVGRCLSTGHIVGLANHTCLLTRDGRKLAVEDSASPIRDGERPTGVVLVFRDVTEKREMERQLAHQARYDYLTQIPNRVLFHDRLDQSLARAKRSGSPLALLYMDLDSFKEINDTLGHAAGDIVLRHAAERLVKAVREEDTVARMGGDEFTVIMTGFSGREEVMDTVGRLFSTLSGPLMVGGQEVSVTASVGVAVFPEDGEDADRLLRNADIAMYKAKERRGNAVEFFRSELTGELEKRVSFSAAFRRAIEHSELFLEFQPEVEIASGRIRGIEALVRWNHPLQGRLLPESFLPQLLRAGLMPELSHWVLKKAARQALSWTHAPGEPPLPVSVNLSFRELRGPISPVVRLREVLAETGLPPERLEIEIAFPDGRLGEDSPILAGIRELGVRLVADDFGDGVVSLDLLRSGLFDRVKLSRQLSSGGSSGGFDPKVAAMLRAILSMLRDLEIPAVAKGAESLESVRIFREAGLRFIQGYGVSRPLSPQEIAGLAVSGRIGTGVG
jgi:diguanylate cyclase (GGDEF)-like protein/PAS domain S-box-containing protein